MSKTKYRIYAFAGILSAMSASTALAESGMIELSVQSLPAGKANGLDKVTTASTQNRNLGILTHKPDETTMPRWIAVSLNDQSLKMYQGADLISRSNVSSGKPGHDTPTGIFSILGKRKYHESNIYSSAPMPFMQRLTWSGIALHESNSVPGYPASHGCVRLPKGFAKDLYIQTTHGIHVIISPEEVAPKWVNHPSLFYSNKTEIDLANLRSGISDYDAKLNGKIRGKNKAPNPLRIYITRATKRDEIRYVQTQLFDLGYTYSEPDGLYGKMSIDAVRRFQSANSLKRTGTINDELLNALKIMSGGKSAPKAKVYVRQDKTPIFEAEINLLEPEKPLGTHLLMTSPNAKAGQPWLSVSMSSRIPFGVIRDHDMDQELKNTRVFGNVRDALDRIIIPDSAREFIEYRLKNGASFAISDNGLGTETGDGTDFIVQTN